MAPLNYVESLRLSKNRQQGPGASLTEEIEGDEIALVDYRPYQAGGPIHLINVTLNETIEGHSQIEYRDRKGLAMAVGPAGVSVGVRHHALWTRPEGFDTTLMPERAIERGAEDTGYHIWSHTPTIHAQPLLLGAWSGISGAAVSPGLGAQTSLGLSLLLGIGNVRLGYWWNSGIDPYRQRGSRPKPLVRLQRAFAWLLPVQSAFMQELLAQFYGPHQQYWFLSDSGHFENTACYELLRRRVPIILICDDGADPEYGFEDLANLVRKARLDFAADVELLDRDDVEHVIGSLSDLRPRVPDEGVGGTRSTLPADLGARLARAHVTIARVLYNDDLTGRTRPRAHSVIVLVKPTLTGNESVDVLQYAASHRTFPQEPRTEQFFDEAQWESYRKLGEHIADVLLPNIDLDRLHLALAETG